MSKQIQEKQFEEEVLSVDRVTRVVAGGRRLRFRAVVVVGDRNGKIALGTGKSIEVNGAVQKATRQAKKNMKQVPIFNGTIPHEITVKYKSAHVRLMPARAGTGIKAGSVVRKILALAGYKNILSKMYGSANKLLNAQALLKSLVQLKERTVSKKPTEDGEENKVAEDRRKVVVKTNSISSRKPEPLKERDDRRGGGGRGGRPGAGGGRGGPRRDFNQPRNDTPAAPTAPAPATTA